MGLGLPFLLKWGSNSKGVSKLGLRVCMCTCESAKHAIEFDLCFSDMDHRNYLSRKRSRKEVDDS